MKTSWRLLSPLQAPHTASTPRFKSRAVFEQRRCATPDA
jgi:hypothetical protein